MSVPTSDKIQDLFRTYRNVSYDIIPSFYTYYLFLNII